MPMFSNSSNSTNSTIFPFQSTSTITLSPCQMHIPTLSPRQSSSDSENSRLGPDDPDRVKGPDDGPALILFQDVISVVADLVLGEILREIARALGGGEAGGGCFHSFAFVSIPFRLLASYISTSLHTQQA